MARDNDDRILSGPMAFAILLIVLLLIVVVVIADRIPHSQRPTLRQPLTTTIVITNTPRP